MKQAVGRPWAGRSQLLRSQLQAWQCRPVQALRTTVSSPMVIRSQSPTVMLSRSTCSAQAEEMRCVRGAATCGGAGGRQVLP